ncbi:hypothetical protein GLOTRDRAFT_122886 [Gloeophyllum trabeum ATCC 11539]|uniref:Uncharacterized protein n=1 Tax=Gloeophyllum trabeum (strain ATCC 11539 / FP-39264 / Madison 617) TaxID=670483 RepID=S7PY33_GLOTA|nr:uncharacterized protein GLOTRDRAFT_122886 [Gloeophyllum trabeum ATCC 11539]EPQ52262.1 hypothetical protein GLOTRDRAFT_122886 [Gloeophyllum trabeum ATCC 11539]
MMSQDAIKGDYLQYRSSAILSMLSQSIGILLDSGAAQLTVGGHSGLQSGKDDNRLDVDEIEADSTSGGPPEKAAGYQSAVRPKIHFMGPVRKPIPRPKPKPKPDGKPKRGGHAE